MQVIAPIAFHNPNKFSDLTYIAPPYWLYTFTLLSTGFILFTLALLCALTLSNFALPFFVTQFLANTHLRESSAYLFQS